MEQYNEEIKRLQEELVNVKAYAFDQAANAQKTVQDIKGDADILLQTVKDIANISGVGEEEAFKDLKAFKEKVAEAFTNQDTE